MRRQLINHQLFIYSSRERMQHAITGLQGHSTPLPLLPPHFKEEPQHPREVPKSQKTQ